MIHFAHILPAALLLALSPAALAQPDPAPCDEASLAQAEGHYAAGELEQAQTLAMACADSGDARAIRGHRLLALTMIRQGNIDDAQLSIVRILGADYDYRPDAALDPPFYIALVSTVRDQLRVETPASTPSAPASARTAPVGPAVAVGARPARVSLPALVEDLPQATPPAPQAAEALAAEAPAPARLDRRINVNAASAADLQTVRGIGPALADRIVAYRAENGPFHTADDLQDVRGIGPKSVQRLASQLAFGNRVSERGSSDDTRPARTAFAGPVLDLNTATVEELDTLPGIGPALAARIVAYREEQGRFRRVEDVIDVRGIGPKVLQGFADRVAVE